MTHCISEPDLLKEAAEWLLPTLSSFRQEFPAHTNPSQACRVRWNALLCQADLVALTWPREYGGRARPTADLIAFHELCASHGAPQPINSIAHSILAPTLLQFGTDAQKARFLPGIRDGSEIWCQGYSEPGSGSDLASVRTRGTQTPAGWVVKGHKIWTTQAHLARWCFALVRTDPDSTGHRGLSFMLIDMQAPGVRVSPIRQLTGEADYNEVFFENVPVTAENIVGEVGQGWRIAMAAAEYERGIYFLPRVVQLEHEFERAEALFDRAVLETNEAHSYAHRLQEARDRCQVIRWRVEQVVSRVAAGSTPGIDGAILKLLWSETRQMVVELQLELLGERAVLGPEAEGEYAADASTVREFLWSRAETIVAGTSEIQRNIIAERLLGLPKDKSTDGN
ncbi:acyl-CoA dehydrogenase family protein [Cupriavidus sp. L7L]|uniref:acyl-CoA dehydrogenase family protein n=1 Tax=Cupriavidus sp. L7L TaxID=2546443 RepID=UPI0010549AAC|nr:acyl-CoA dehydrogenase family protein [Cupriavidus sp. L7L]TDF64503.1 acyl-CoA dehydrogenase [Cupriavidus sp. L7L]